MKNNPLPRLDQAPALRQKILPFCRLRPGEIWLDPTGNHRVGCLDATQSSQIDELMCGQMAQLAIHDPPYNLIAFQQQDLGQYLDWCRQWVSHTWRVLDQDSSFYIWLGADQKDHFKPLPDFMMMMREFDFETRSYLTMRNQRGYGTQKNWMAVRQELLYYVKGKPPFQVTYTDIPKILRGYYKAVNGKKVENLERSKSNTIRPGNVWVDIQQVFYRMEENVSGCYAQKPIRAQERIITSSSAPHDIVIDFFSHSGATLVASELHQRRCFTMDVDPVYCEISIRRLEHLRKTGKRGWQNGHPFEQEL